MKPETELKRVIKSDSVTIASLWEENRHLRNRADNADRELDKVKRELVEWKARFDILLRREESSA